MNKDQLKYLDTTDGPQICPKSWAMLGTDATVEGLETKWSGALSRLKNSSSKRKVETYNRLAKMTRVDRRALFESALQNVTSDTNTPNKKKSLSKSSSSSKSTSAAFPSSTHLFSRHYMSDFLRYAEELDQQQRQQQQQDDDIDRPLPWILSSGTNVDSILIEYAKDLKTEDPIHSFILDTSNSKIMRLFSTDDQREIKEPTRPRVPVDPRLVQFLATLHSTTISDLRSRLKTNDSDDVTHFTGTEDLQEQRRIRRWAYATLLSIADLFEYRDTNGYGTEHQKSEQWYNLHIWRMLDDLLLNDPTLSLVRGEASSPASSIRKNQASREPGDRKKMGHRIDGLLFARWENLEVGGCEIGAEEHDTEGAKYLQDGLKLMKLLKDQHDRIQEQRPTVPRLEIETVGLQMLGRTLVVSSMDWCGGSFLRYRREQPVTVPITVAQTKELLRCMSQLLSVISRMHKNIDRIQHRQLGSLVDDLSDPFTTPPQSPCPPPTATTPIKKKDSTN
ncbi:hypothetical protein BG015_006473 [Linnemannia schmuckeri]|uniref:Uncharacterized protein n=1 Tax=Linnemannia schmuckeri TaxID=64567 RepID=A0A9P5VEV5_9FUNG|nr:hypothetical protein BG015_006473 [Linnemannia schmuckeri]